MTSDDVKDSLTINDVSDSLGIPSLDKNLCLYLHMLKIYGTKVFD